MLLQCDPTTIYALKRLGQWRGFLARSELTVDEPYNTYVRAGLPPGPICNPGLASLRAAVAPADVDYRYFVAAGDGIAPVLARLRGAAAERRPLPRSAARGPRGARDSLTRPAGRLRCNLLGVDERIRIQPAAFRAVRPDARDRRRPARRGVARRHGGSAAAQAVPARPDVHVGGRRPDRTPVRHGDGGRPRRGDAGPRGGARHRPRRHRRHAVPRGRVRRGPHARRPPRRRASSGRDASRARPPHRGAAADRPRGRRAPSSATRGPRTAFSCPRSSRSRTRARPASSATASEPASCRPSPRRGRGRPSRPTSPRKCSPPASRALPEIFTASARSCSRCSRARRRSPGVALEAVESSHARDGRDPRSRGHPPPAAPRAAPRPGDAGPQRRGIPPRPLRAPVRRPVRPLDVQPRILPPEELRAGDPAREGGDGRRGGDRRRAARPGPSRRRSRRAAGVSSRAAGGRPPTRRGPAGRRIRPRARAARPSSPRRPSGPHPPGAPRPSG